LPSKKFAGSASILNMLPELDGTSWEMGDMGETGMTSDEARVDVLTWAPNKLWQGFKPSTCHQHRQISAGKGGL